MAISKKTVLVIMNKLTSSFSYREV